MAQAATRSAAASAAWLIKLAGAVPALGQWLQHSADGSQFFITFKETAYPTASTRFGEVAEGLE